MTPYERSVERARVNQAEGVAKFAKLFETLPDDELRAKLARRSGASPWQRLAAQRVLKARNPEEATK